MEYLDQHKYKLLNDYISIVYQHPSFILQILYKIFVRNLEQKIKYEPDLKQLIITCISQLSRKYKDINEIMTIINKDYDFFEGPNTQKKEKLISYFVLSLIDLNFVANENTYKSVLKYFLDVEILIKYLLYKNIKRPYNLFSLTISNVVYDNILKIVSIYLKEQVFIDNNIFIAIRKQITIRKRKNEEYENYKKITLKIVNYVKYKRPKNVQQILDEKNIKIISDIFEKNTNKDFSDFKIEKYL